MRKRIEGEHGSLVDIHCHVLPEVDDGARSLTEALEMISIAEKEGITKIICTPHFKSQHRNISGQRLVEVFHLLKNESIKVGNKVELYLGNEVFYFKEIEDALEQKKLQTMNGSNFLLVEFHPSDAYQYIRNALDDIACNDIFPVLAHVERYECFLKHPEYVEELHRLGIKIQVNASSVIGGGGLKVKHFVKVLLSKKLVDYMATDAHRSSGRAPYMKKCRDYLYKKYDAQYIDEVLTTNAIRDFELN